jgi:hypothetical protein
MTFRLIAWAISMLIVARAEYGHDQPFDSSKHRPIEVISIVGEVSSPPCSTAQVIPLTVFVAEALGDKLCDAPTATKHPGRSEEDS